MVDEPLIYQTKTMLWKVYTPVALFKELEIFVPHPPPKKAVTGVPHLPL